MWGGGWGYWGWWFWAFWLVIIIGIFFAVPWRGRRTRDPEEQILRDRYARGEIDREEFNQRMRDLHRAA